MGIQTYSLTHNKDGSLKEPYQKDFIDFSFNGKYISEFGVVAVFDGGRFNFDGSPESEDEISEINGADGQQFWGTRFKIKKRTFKLATDGMTERQINDFKKHFMPGKYGRFIEDRQEYRYSYCRVSQPARFSMVPFRTQQRISNSIVYTNLYKGDIALELTWDKPYEYGSYNYFDAEENKLKMEEKRALINDGVPCSTSWHNIISPMSRQNYFIAGETLLLDSPDLANNIPCYLGKDKILNYKDGISGLYPQEENKYSYDKYSYPLFYYNPSSYPSAPTLKLEFKNNITTPDYEGEWKPVYFTSISDSSFSQNHASYNSIKMSNQLFIEEDSSVIPTIDSDFVSEFKYTAPNFIRSVNKAIKLAYDFYLKTPTGLGSDLEEKIREEITHNKVLKWAISVLAIVRKKATYSDPADNFLDGKMVIHKVFSEGTFSANWFAYFNILMLCIMAESESKNITGFNLETENDWKPLSNFIIIINGEDSKYSFIFKYNSFDNDKIKFEESEENCGDIALSPYLRLEGGDILNPETLKISTVHALQFLQGGSLDNCPLVTLEYKNVYL